MIVSALVIISLLLVAVGAGVGVYFGGLGLTILNLSVSGVLSAALVILYFRQAETLESQKRLLTQELNREARQQHTETLRDRVEIWHGNPVQREAPDPFSEPRENFPVVTPAGFKSAAQAHLVGEDPEFQVLPSQLVGDRYVHDLLTNHAPDLNSTKERIESRHAEFVDLRDTFQQDFDYGIQVERDQYILEPVEFLSRWVFEQLIRFERGFYDDLDELREVAIERVQSGETTIYREKSLIWIQVDLGGGRASAIYSAVPEIDDTEAIQELRSPAQEETVQLVDQIFDRYDEEGIPQIVTEAATVLDSGQTAIEELDQLLVEYHGRPIYPGDCGYLEEARL